MLKDRLSPADEAARDKEMREELTTCPRILDLVARGPLADPAADAVVYLRSPLDPNPVVVSNDHLMGCIKAAETYFRAQGVGKEDAVAVLLPICPAAIAAIWGAAACGIAEPLNLLFTREAIIAQLNAVKAKLLLAPPPGMPGGLYEKIEGLQTRRSLAEADRDRPARRHHRVRRRGAEARSGLARRLRPIHRYVGGRPGGRDAADRRHHRASQGRAADQPGDGRLLGFVADGAGLPQGRPRHDLAAAVSCRRSLRRRRRRFVGGHHHRHSRSCRRARSGAGHQLLAHHREISPDPCRQRADDARRAGRHSRW